MIDPKLKEFATERQAFWIDEINKHGSARKAAAANDMARTTLDKAINSVKKKAAARGYAPEHDMTHIVPDAFTVAGTSTLYDADGNQKLQWVKTKQGAQTFEEIQNAIREGLLGDIPESRIVEAPERVNSDLMTVYPMGDPHIGMYAWAAEAGEDFDCEIAETQLIEATRRLVDCSPPSEFALIVNLGDFFHSDTLDNRTRRSGNALDVDTRMSKVWEIGIRAMRECIDAAKAKHQLVTVRNEIGNHDDHTSIMLSLALREHYRNDERVHIDTSPAKFFYLKFGQCLIGTTHGDTVRLPQLAGVMACDQPEHWGQTKHRYWYTGHFHSSKVEEYPGVLVEQFRTLAAKDAWTAGAGYRAGRDMRCIVLHKDHGEIERHRVDVGLLEAA